MFVVTDKLWDASSKHESMSLRTPQVGQPAASRSRLDAVLAAGLAKNATRAKETGNTAMIAELRNAILAKRTNTSTLGSKSISGATVPVINVLEYLEMIRSYIGKMQGDLRFTVLNLVDTWRFHLSQMPNGSVSASQIDAMQTELRKAAWALEQEWNAFYRGNNRGVFLPPDYVDPSAPQGMGDGGGMPYAEEDPESEHAQNKGYHPLGLVQGNKPAPPG